MNNQLKSLLKLLDDEDEQSASFAMAELLKYRGEIDPILRDIQESDNPRLRRRVHQLERILSIRRRRSRLPSALVGELNLVRGLGELHFLWYDNDDEEVVVTQWNRLLAKATGFQPNSIDRLAYFMRKAGFTTADKEEIEADYYCVGIVLEELVGADFILCALAKELAAQFQLDLRIATCLDEFVLVGRDGRSVAPASNWRVGELHPKSNLRECDNFALFKLTAATLYLCAVSTDSFRYIYTIGNCLARMCGESNAGLFS